MKVPTEAASSPASCVARSIGFGVGFGFGLGFSFCFLYGLGADADVEDDDDVADVEDDDEDESDDDDDADGDRRAWCCCCCCCVQSTLPKPKWAGSAGGALHRTRSIREFLHRENVASGPLFSRVCAGRTTSATNNSDLEPTATLHTNHSS